MTTEVAILNRSAVALAADSAVSVESVSRGRMTTKVFNTANKLFTLSKVAPIGVMVYNTMTLGGVPWETVIKQYRRHLGERRIAKLEGYCDHFFEFLTDNEALFSPADQNEITFNLVLDDFAMIFRDKDDDDEMRHALERRYAELEQKKRVPHFKLGFEDHLEKLYGDRIEYAAELIADGKALSQATRKLCRAFGCLLLTRADRLNGYSGLVFAGFGEGEVYPRMRQYIVDAVLANKVKFSFEEEWSVNYLERSHVVPFAQREVVQTVLDGVSPSFARRFIEESIKMVSGLPEAIINSISELDQNQKQAYINSSVVSAGNAFRDLVKQLDQHRVSQYSRPIEQSIGIMPMSELALVAELLVNLSQIRQKMSLDAETVGGPVDVAVISKGDGFVWIKRKHYFDRELNPMFISRYYSDLAPGSHGGQQGGRGDDG